MNNNSLYYSFIHSQEVSIHGLHTLGNPSFHSSTCHSINVEFVTESQYELYLTGNHQLLEFEIFS